MEMKEIKCPDCGANLKYDGSKPFITCEYCGTEIALELDQPNQQAGAPQGAPSIEDMRMQRLELREEIREERHRRHEERREERHERHMMRRGLDL